MPHWLTYDALRNARDLGDHPTGDGRRVAAGRALRGDTVVHLTERGADQFVRHAGVRTVLDLRSPIELELDGQGHMAAWYASGVVHHANVPLLTDDGFTKDVVGRGGDEAGAYFAYLQHGGRTLAHAIAEAAERGALYIHCAAGKDRTGVVSATILSALDVPRQHILNDFAASTQRLESILRAIWQRPAYSRDAHSKMDDALRLQASKPESISGFLDLLDHHHGGAHAWFASHGVDVQKLREKLLTPHHNSHKEESPQPPK